MFNVNSSISNNVFWCKWKNCKLYFKQSNQLYEHLTEYHVGRKNTSTFKSGNKICLDCNWEGCNVKTSKRDHIISHLKVHVDYRPFGCNFCPKKFKRNQDLKKHCKQHNRNISSNNDNDHLNYKNMSRLSYENSQNPTIFYDSIWSTNQKKSNYSDGNTNFNDFLNRIFKTTSSLDLNPSSVSCYTPQIASRLNEIYYENSTEITNRILNQIDDDETLKSFNDFMYKLLHDVQLDNNNIDTNSLNDSGHVNTNVSINVNSETINDTTYIDTLKIKHNHSKSPEDFNNYDKKQNEFETIYNTPQNRAYESMETCTNINHTKSNQNVVSQQSNMKSNNKSLSEVYKNFSLLNIRNMTQSYSVKSNADINQKKIAITRGYKNRHEWLIRNIIKNVNEVYNKNHSIRDLANQYKNAKDLNYPNLEDL